MPIATGVDAKVVRLRHASATATLDADGHPGPDSDEDPCRTSEVVG